MQPRARPAAGFTLLELIVVIAIFGVMATMAYGGLASVLHTRARVEESLGRLAEYQKAYMRLRGDFQQVRNRPARDPYGDLQPAFGGDVKGRVTFSRGGWRNPLLQPRPNIERVFYYLDADKKSLIRGSYRVLDQAQDSKVVEVPLLSNVQDVTWRYMDSAHTWQSIWPPLSSGATAATAAQQAPPIAIELVVHTKDMGELRFLFRDGVEPLNATTSGSSSSGTAGGKGITNTSNQSDSSNSTDTPPTEDPNAAGQSQ